jgi:hypothetical protein
MVKRKRKGQRRSQTMANSLAPPLLTLRTGCNAFWFPGGIFELLSVHQYTTSLNIGIALEYCQIMIISYSSNPSGATHKSEYNEIILTHLTKCVVCFRPVDSTALSLLIEDTHFCRPCWDEVMKDESMDYLDSPRFMRRQPA